MMILLALLLVAGCTRSKSEGPSDATVAGTAAAAPTQGTGGDATATLSGGEAINATANAMAATETAKAAAPTAGAATETPQPTEVTATDAAPTEAAATEAAPTATKAPTSAEPTATTAPAEAGTPATHTVQEGENLFRIALKYGLSYQTVAAYNGITNPNIIIPGQQIKIPSTDDGETPPAGEEGTYVVQSGENLFRIALKYNMTYTQLAAANNLAYPYTIYPGQKLVIP
jgi:LysM repeat protein